MTQPTPVAPADRVPSSEELRWIVNKVQVSTPREGEVWRWLSEHVSGLLEDRARTLRGEFTAIDIDPPESPGDVRVTFNIPAKEYRAKGKMRLAGFASIVFEPDADREGGNNV